MENEKKRIDLIEGKNPVLEILKSGRPINKIYVLKNSKDRTIGDIVIKAKKLGIILQQTTVDVLDSISETRVHQGVIAFVAAKRYVDVDEILEDAKTKGEDPFLLILDGVTDENNLGSIIRSAVCMGVHGIILPERRSASLTSTVFKVSAGALEYMPVARVTNLVRTISDLKKESLWIGATDSTGDVCLEKVDLKGPLALVIGSEGKGVSRLVAENCDFTVSIPMKGQITSLNAGVAAALVMFEAYKQRGV